MILEKISHVLGIFSNKIIIGFLTIFSLLSSCVIQRQVEYLRGNDTITVKFIEAEFPNYMLKSNDELYIQINSLDEENANIFSNARQQSTYVGALQPYGASLISYSVDKEGYLLLSLIGSIYVKNKTLSEVSTIIMDSLKNILSQPVVSVKLVNRYVTVLGEVLHPGHYSYSQEKLTVFDALGLAGDITDYGNRNKVILVRNEMGENIRINMDLTLSDILTSDYYNLRPNDMIYVKPLMKKFWGMRQFPFAVLLSTITTGLLIYNYVK